MRAAYCRALLVLHLSPYQFSWNNPINLSDPSGECPFGINCKGTEQWFQDTFVAPVNKKIDQIKRDVQEVRKNISEKIKKLPKISAEFTTHACICVEIKAGNLVEVGLNLVDAELTNSGFTLEEGQGKEHI